MKLAVSNIAWQQHDDQEILKLLQDNGVSGIEVAPTKLWNDWKGASYQSAQDYKNKMRDQGFDLPSMQAILFGKPELQLFDKSSHARFLEHFKLLAELANGLGSRVLVFGSPKNRKRGQIAYTDAMKIAADFFYEAAEICISNDCCIGLEPNPIEYGCDFINNVFDAKELVKTVNNEGFKLHLDSAGIHMCGGSISDVIYKAGEFVHYHISEPMLAPIFGGTVAHKECIAALRNINYKRWVSIEMKQPSSVHILDKSLNQVKEFIGE